MPKNSPQIYPKPFPSMARPVSQRDRKSRGSKRSFRRRLEYLYWRLVRLQGNPKVLARGFACGVFAGLFPFAGSQTVLALLLAFIFRGNKILAAVGPWISNPFTSVPIYLFNFKVGKWLLNEHSMSNLTLQSWEDVKELGIEIIWPLFVGCVTVGSICAIISYFLGLWLIHKVRTSQQRRRHRRLHRRYPKSS
ncbi:MAG TPA: DUF2062 domain-containing protein [Cyanobacteria bacterium UBA8553]|nr:DUF2062 domain-containing protein [Cyanobacteria bacterium UBA8553]HAJ58515.1 DUF2062 domain-containing protein [Cyanobacteria bacterium UBA8543]